MTGTVRIPRAILGRVDLGRVDPGAPGELERRLLARGRAVLGGFRTGDPLDELRGQLARRAAALALLRDSVLAARARAAAVASWERRTYREHLRLEREEVPPLKLRARELRAEIRALEAELRARGVDPALVQPSLPEDTLAVDDYEPPRYRDADERRRRAVEFFRRLEG